MVASRVKEHGYAATVLYGGKNEADFEYFKGECRKLGASLVHMAEFESGKPIEWPLLNNHPNPSRARKIYASSLAYSHKKNTRKLKLVEVKVSGIFGKWRKKFGRLLSQPFEHSNVWPLHTALCVNMNQRIACLEQLSPDAIVVVADGISGPMDLLTVARHRDIPVVTVPYGFPLRIDLDISLKQKANTGTLFTTQQPYGDLVGKHCKQWVKQGVCEGALMFSPEYIAALESIGVTLERPWAVLGDLGDVLCAESEVNRQHYLAEGVPEEKIVLSGSPYCDMILRSATCNPVAMKAFKIPRVIEKGRIRLLVSWPPSYHDKYQGQSEFSSYEEMTTRTFELLGSIDNCDITISCHPAMSDREMSIIEQSGGVVSKDYVIDLIPLSDIFFSFFTSTTRWAIASGKLVLNYDMYKLGLDIYDTAPGFYTQSSLLKIIDRLKYLAASEEAVVAALSEQINVADRWGIMDGGCNDRVLSIIDRQIRNINLPMLH